MSYDKLSCVAVFKTKCANAKIKVNNVDHNPPHCHVFPGGRQVLVDLATLEIIRPVGASLSPAVMDCLRKYQVQMLEAWNDVTVEDAP